MGRILRPAFYQTLVNSTRGAAASRMILFLTIVIATLGPLLLGSGPGVILPVIVIFWLTGLASAFGIPVTVNGGVDAFRLVPSTVLGVVLTLIGCGISLVVQYVGHAIQPTEGVSLRTALDGGPLNRPHPLFWEHEGTTPCVQATGRSCACIPKRGSCTT